MNPRQQRAKQMLETKDYCSQINQNQFKVKSQTNPEKYYIVSKTDNGLICECKDHLTRKSDCKHIHVTLEIIRQNKCYRNSTFRIMDRSKLQLCKYCDSGRIVKKGIRKNKSGNLQIYKCKDCKRRFTMNCGFESRRFADSIITNSLETYYSGMSVRDVSRQYRRM